MFVLTLHRLLAGGNRIAAAHRGTLQCVNHVLCYLPRLVTLEIPVNPGPHGRPLERRGVCGQSVLSSPVAGFEGQINYPKLKY